MDIGCYLVNTSRFIFEREPVRVVAIHRARSRSSQVDRLTSIMLDFDGGHAIGTCSTQMTPTSASRSSAPGPHRDRNSVQCSTRPAVPDRRSTATDFHGSGVETIEFAACDQYTIQAELFSRAVIDDTRSIRRSRTPWPTWRASRRCSSRPRAGITYRSPDSTDAAERAPECPMPVRTSARYSTLMEECVYMLRVRGPSP